jgi:hypothetical protein
MSNDRLLPCPLCRIHVAYGERDSRYVVSGMHAHKACVQRANAVKKREADEAKQSSATA